MNAIRTSIISGFLIVSAGCVSPSARQPANEVTSVAQAAPAYSASVMQSELRRLLASLTDAQVAPVELFQYQTQPIKVELTDKQIQLSASVPQAIPFDFALYRGAIYEASFFRKSVYTATGQDVIGDPLATIAAEPFISVDSSSHLTWHQHGGSQNLLQSFLASQGPVVHLYRGTTIFELRIRAFFRDLLKSEDENSVWDNHDSANFSAALNKIAADPVNKTDLAYIPKWRQFEASGRKKNSTRLQMAIAASKFLSGQMQGSFTTPDAKGASIFAFQVVLANDKPRPNGVVLAFDIPKEQLTQEIMDSIYAGIELENSTYIEICFMKNPAHVLLLKNLSPNPILKPL